MPKLWEVQRKLAALNETIKQLRQQGRYEQAIPAAREGLQLALTHLGPAHPDTAASFLNLGDLLRARGDLAGARPYLERALAIWKKALGSDHPHTATCLNNLGLLLQARGDLAGALSYLERALAIRQKALGPKHPQTATCLNNLSLVLQAQGDLAEARPYYERALAIRQKVLGPDHPDTAQSLTSLGYLVSAQGDLAGARPYYEQALAIFQKALGPEHPSTATSLNNLGVLLQARGDLAGARPYLERALAIRQKVLGPDHPDTASNIGNLAALCVALGQQAQAMTWMLQAAAIHDRMIGRIFSISSERQRMAFLQIIRRSLEAVLSLVVEYLGQSTEAACAALELVLRRKAIATEALAAQRDAVLGGKYPTLEAPLRRLADLRMRIAQKTLAGPGPEGWPAHRHQLGQWHSQKEQLEAELSRQIPEMSLEQRLRQADRRAVALALPEGVCLVEFVRFRVSDFKAVPTRAKRSWLPARYLAFVLAGGEPDRVQMIDLGEAEPIDRLIADFRSAITGEAEQPGGRNMVRRHPEPAPGAREDAGRRLCAAVFDKLAPALGGHRRLLLAPDGDLTRVPFEVLLAADGRLLIDDYQISYVGCGRDVLRFGAQPAGLPADPLVVADPDFDLVVALPDPLTDPTAHAIAIRDLAFLQPLGEWSLPAQSTGSARPAGERVVAPRQPAEPCGEACGRCSRDLDRGRACFGRLPGTRGEGERVATLLGVQPWLGRDALERRLKQSCRSPRILHLATHGFFLRDQPDTREGASLDFGLAAGPGPEGGRLPENPLLRSGLALAGANTWLNHGRLPAEAEDGLLTAEDVSGMDLLATELVVLSACETGLGEVHTGEGVFGLQRAFVLAGAKTLVMSLWSVPDEATRELMVNFYERTLGGEPRADALRAAQTDLRRRYPDPLYWGAFVCLGDPGPLSPARPGP
jgi:tetratricopeptide (TPR) repeat protein